MKQIDQLLANHIEQQPPQLTAELCEKFRTNNVVKLEQALPFDIAEQLTNEAVMLVDKHGERRDMHLEATGGTLRAYTSVSRNAVRAFDGIIPKVFASEVFKKYLSQIAGEPLYPVPYEPEEYTVNSQLGIGDEHGWHFDDYTYALIWVAEAPHPLEGGRVEYINFTEWDKSAPREQMIELLKTREVKSLYIPAGSFYLSKARYLMHRVTPLLSNDARRTVIVYTFANKADLSDASISHETVEAIYNLPAPNEVN